MYVKHSGFGFAPIAAAAATSWTNPVSAVITGASLATSLISTLGKIFGIAPRGDLQKFQRTHYPYMRTVAQQNNADVYCFWFGDLVVVKPDGSYGVAIPVEQLNSMFGSPIDPKLVEPLIPDLEGTNFYYILRNNNSDPVNNPQADFFELYYQGQKVNEADLTGIIPTTESPTSGLPAPGSPAGTTTPNWENIPLSGAGIMDFPQDFGYFMPILVLGGLALVISLSSPPRIRRSKT